MVAAARITRIRVTEFWVEMQNTGVDYNGFNLVYEPGNTRRLTHYLFSVETSLGITGDYIGGNPVAVAQVGMLAHYLLGRDPFQRERIYNDAKRALRKHDRMGLGPIDIALWDIAGKAYGVPVYQLLGGWKTHLPAQASTYHGDHQPGGLSSPAAFAEFALQCKEMGYRAFKIHGWGQAPIAQEAANVLAVRAAVGPDMALMIDPACEYTTWADALYVGRACDEASFFWLEDPYKDGGISAFAHARLRGQLKTPLLQGEHVRTLEPHVDFALAGGTDYMRIDCDYDGGLTGGLKIAHAAEGLGLDAEIHAPGPAHRHLMASIRNTNYYELGLVHPHTPETSPPVYIGYSDALDAIDANGCVPVPQGPGLGVELDWGYITSHTSNTLIWE